jgi:putative N6-adenine-specific DNA methylase
MPQFVATTSQGLQEALIDELSGLKFQDIRKVAGGAEFSGEWSECYRANLLLRSATRILLPVLEFEAQTGGDLYHGVMKHDFTQYIPPEKTLAVDSSVTDSPLRDQRFVALKAKDAIVDQFREKCGRRPDVDAQNPDLKVFVRARGERVLVAIDTTGDPLFKRGYRFSGGDAPVKEHVAAGLLQLSGWNREIPIVDPMCGSGTFLVEAALMAMKVAPGSLRKGFAFQSFSNFDGEVWSSLLNDVMGEEREELPFKFYGFDISKKTLKTAEKNAERAGVDECVVFKQQPVQELEPPCEKGVIIVNPPYGHRLGDEDALRDIYRDFGYVLKRHFQGWDVWLLSGNAKLPGLLGLKASRKHQVFNGPLECRWLHYEIRKTSV